MNKVTTKALDYTIIEGCRIETYLRYNPDTEHLGIITTRRGNYTSERGKRATYQRDYRKENPEAERARLKRWCDKNPEYHHTYLKGYNLAHKEEFKQRDKLYYEEHKITVLARNRRYASDHPRDPRDYILPPYKCTKLNQWFDGCRCHHVDPSTIIHVPKDMHVSHVHNIRTGAGMDFINALAFEFLFKE